MVIIASAKIQKLWHQRPLDLEVRNTQTSWQISAVWYEYHDSFQFVKPNTKFTWLWFYSRNVRTSTEFSIQFEHTRFHSDQRNNRIHRTCPPSTHLNWIHIVSNDDQLSFLLFNQFRHGVGAGLQCVWSLFRLDILALGLSFGNFLQTLLLSQCGLWTIFLQQFEQLYGGLLVQSLAELVDWWWNFQTLLQDSLLSLYTDVLGPSDETGQITFRLNVLTCEMIPKQCTR